MNASHFGELKQSCEDKRELVVTGEGLLSVVDFPWT